MRTTTSLTLLLTALIASSSLLAADTPANGEKSGNSASAGKIAKGLMFFHQERLIFSPCREPSYVETDDVSPGKEASAALRKLGLAEGKPLYVELSGEASGGALRIEGINFAHTEGRCHALRQTHGKWRAVGRNPAWNMTTTADTLRLQQEGRPDIEGKFTETPQPGSSATALRVQASPEYAWELRQQLCHQPEDGIVTGWTASADVQGVKLTGCAWHP